MKTGQDTNSVSRTNKRTPATNFTACAQSLRCENRTFKRND